MAKNKDKEKQEKVEASPLQSNQRFMGLLLSGDNRAARAEAKKVLADAAATEQDKAAAREVLERTGLDKGTLAVGLVGLAILLVIIALVSPTTTEQGAAMYESYLKLLDKLGQLRLESFDASILTNTAKDLPLMVGVALLVAGLVSTLVGAQRYVFRLILTPIAVAAGYSLAPQFAQLAHLSPKLASYAGAGLLGLGAVVWPPAVLFLAFGALGGSVGGELAGEKDFWIGFIPGFILGGTLSLVVSRIVAVLVSSALGGIMFVLGLLTLISSTRLAGLVFGLPTLSLGLAGCIAVTGMAFQFKFAPADDDEARAKRKATKLKDKELAKEAKARDKRFKQYGKKVDEASKRAKEEAE